MLPLAGICQSLPSVPKWVDDMGGTGSSIVAAEKIDKQNNTYITGIFSGSVDFDPSPTGVKMLSSVNGSVDIYVAKYDTNGALIWAVAIGGAGTEQPDGIDLDANGNVSIAGLYDSPVLDANPGAGTFNLTNQGGNDMFLINLDVNGNFLWAKSVGGSGTDYANKVAIDNQGDKIIGGQFQSTVTLGATNLTANGTFGGLVAKYDPTGNLLWAFSLGQTGDNGIRGVTADSNSDIVVSGAFSGTVNFNPLGAPYNLTATGNESFVAKYNAAGQLLWVQPINGAVSGYSINICVDSNNNIYAVAPFSFTLTFNGNNTLTAKGAQDVSLSKFSSNGTFQWAEDIGGAGANATNNGITVSNDNNIYISGYFTGSVDFDPSAAVSLITYHGQRDLFLVKYDTNGAYQWAIGAGNSTCNNTLGRSIGVDSNNDVLLGGSFCSTVNFDVSGCTAFNLTAQSPVRDSFLAKYIPAATNLTNDVITAPAVTAFCGSSDPDVITGSLPTGGTGTYSYQWQSSPDGVTFVNITTATAKDYDPAIIAATTYYRRLVTSGTCATSLISNVVKISIQTSLTNNVITAPVLINFCATGDPAVITGTIPASSGTLTYQWQSSTDNVNFADIAGATAKDYDPAVINATTYYRRNASSSSCTVPVSSNVVMVTITQVVSNNVITPPTVISFCATGDPGIVAGNTPTGGTGTYAYQWQRSTDNINFTNITSATLKDYDPPVVNVTTYYRRQVTSGICNVPVNSNTVTITISVMPVITVSTATTICLGSSVNLNASGGTTYQWTPAAGLSDANIANPVASPSATTTYTVTVTNGSCSATDTVTIAIVPLPIVNAGADKIILGGDNIQLNGTVTGNNVQYSWSPPTYLDDPNSLTPIASPPADITYTLTATSAQGCFVISDDIFIRVYAKILIPNTFTPNGDGINDTWDIAALNTYSACQVSVFNRYGAIVYKSIGYNKAWDGTYKGSMVPFGTYYYTIDLKDGTKTRSGWVTIVR
jgi:gliding motility-associated-like protein